MITREQAESARALKDAGASWSDLAKRYKRNPRTLRRTLSRMWERGADESEAGLDVRAEPVANDVAPTTVRSVAPEAMRPEALPPIRDPQIVSGLEKILIIPDTHVPFEDGAAFATMMAAARVFRPDTIVFLGDFADFSSVSFHPRTLGVRGYTLEEEVAAVNARLDEVEALGASRVVFVKGNHEYRLERYLSEKAPELFGLVDTAALFRFTARGWSVVEYRHHLKIGKMHFTHDVGHAGIYAHRQSRMAYEGNVVIGHCLPIDYEVLTSTRGFVKLSDVTTSDRALSYKGGHVVEGPISEVVRWRYTGEMAKFDCFAISQSMTDKHHIFTRDGRYIPVREAVNVLTKADLVLQAKPMDAPEYPVSDDMLRFVVAYCADGSRGSQGSLRFHLKKPRKIARLTELLGRLGSSVAWGKPGKNGGMKTKRMGRAVQHAVIVLAPSKVLPEWLRLLSARQRQIVIDELILWDGSHIMHDGVDYGSRQFGSAKKEERDLVQFLLAQHGIRSSTGGRCAVSFNVFEKSPDASKKLNQSVEWVPVNNVDVGCITTEHHNFYVRLPCGRVELTGNTHRLGFEVAGTSKGPSHVGIALGWLGDKRAIDYMHAAKASQWTLAFGIAYHERDTGNVHVVPIPIVDYRCVIEGHLIDPLKGTSADPRVRVSA